MSHQIEFYFDCSSPWTYLAFSSAVDLMRATGVDFIWKPFLVGGVFNTVNPSVYANRENPVPVKQRYYNKDLQDWARYTGIQIGAPPVFPVNSVKVMRGAFVAIEEGCIERYARIAFESYWGDLNDISRDDEVRKIAESAGLEPDRFFEKITSQTYKDQLRSNTDELMERGGFGSPTFFVDENDMYFGNDRLPLIRHAIGIES